MFTRDQEMRLKAVSTSLKEMFKKGWLDICTIDSCLKITRAMPNGEDYETLRSLHCIHFKDMNEDLREWVYETAIKMVFNDNGFNFDLIDAAAEIYTNRLDIDRSKNISPPKGRLLRIKA